MPPEDLNLEERARQAMQHQQQQQRSDLENKVDEPASWSKIIWDTIKYAPMAAVSYAAAGPASLILTGGFGLGTLIENKVWKQKTTWNHLYKNMYTGNLLAMPLAGVYILSDYLFGATTSFLGGIAKFLFFNPGLMTPYTIMTRSLEFVRDEYGWFNALKGLVTGKTYAALYNNYQENIKPEMPSLIKNTFLGLGAFHYFNLNYLTSLPARFTVAVGSSTTYRLILGKKENNNKEKEKKSFNQRIKDFFTWPADMPKEDLKPSYRTGGGL